jgi:uncharacterized protein (TIRG00374 family)
MRAVLRRLARPLIVTVVLVALVLFARNVQWSESFSAVRRASPALLVGAALLNLLSLALKAVRWWVFLRPVGVSSFPLALKGTFVGTALNNILVANSGEAGRVVLVARASHVASEKVLATLALERLFELVGYVALLTSAVTFLALPPDVAELRPLAFTSLALVIGLLLYLLRHPEQVELPVLEGEGLLHRARIYGRGFLRTLTAISTPRRFAVALALSFVIWGLQTATYHFTARAADFSISLVGTIAALLAVNLGFAARATPANVGVFQMMYAVTAVTFGLDKDQAIGVALLIQMQQVIPVTILGLLAAPDMLFGARRKTKRPDNVLPGEPDPTPHA